MQDVEQFAVGVVAICLFVLRGVGVIDSMFTDLMVRGGVFSPAWQFVILVALLTFYVVLSLRAIGGLLGWTMLIFAVLLLLHHLAPALSGPNSPFAVHIGNVF